MASFEPAARRTRPGPVTAAVYIMYAIAAFQLLSVLMSIASYSPTVDATRDYLEEIDSADTDAMVTGTQVVIIVGIVFAALFMAAWTVLAILDGKGMQPARIVTWVFGGLFLLCMVCGLAGNALGSSFGGGTGEIDQEELTRRVDDALPGWIGPLGIASTVIELLLALSVVILLALPAAHEFFRKTQPEWQPPYPIQPPFQPPPTG